VQWKADKIRLLKTWRLKRMHAPMTNQIMPKDSPENLATISKLKYFGHIMHSSDCMKKDLMLGLTDRSGK
jgi:hypothetical protein